MREFAKHYGVFTVLAIGLIGGAFVWFINATVKEAIAPLSEKLVAIDGRLNAIEQRQADFNARFGAIEQRLDTIDSRQAAAGELSGRVAAITDIINQNDHVLDTTPPIDLVETGNESGWSVFLNNGSGEPVVQEWGVEQIDGTTTE